MDWISGTKYKGFSKQQQQFHHLQQIEQKQINKKTEMNMAVDSAQQTYA